MIRENHQSAASGTPPTGDVSTTKVHALDRNRTRDLSVPRLTLYPLSQTGFSKNWDFLKTPRDAGQIVKNRDCPAKSGTVWSPYLRSGVANTRLSSRMRLPAKMNAALCLLSLFTEKQKMPEIPLRLSSHHSNKVTKNT